MEFDEKVPYAFDDSSTIPNKGVYAKARQELRGENLLEKFDTEKEEEEKRLNDPQIQNMVKSLFLSF